jgi:hypothetical protein
LVADLGGSDVSKTESTCLTCGFEGLRVPGSLVAGKGYLVDHPGRIWLCREWFDVTAGLGPDSLEKITRDWVSQ